MSVFPQELYDIVISLCDQCSLASCSLVCRNWVPSSRMGLFRNLRPLIISPSSLSQVLLLVDGPVSTISPYITSLVLKDWGSSAADSRSQSFYALLPRITGRMTAVETLVFHGIDWEEMADGALNFLVFYFENTLKTLELRECPYRTFNSVVDLACSFPLLENISLHRLVHSSRSAPSDPRTLEPRSSPPPAARHLRSLHAHGSIKKDLIRWIVKTNLDIEDLALGPILPGEAHVVGKFLKALKSNLKRLTLSGESIPNMHREISLKHNRQLTSIHFVNLMLHRRSEGLASMDWFIHLPSCDTTFQCSEPPVQRLRALEECSNTGGDRLAGFEGMSRQAAICVLGLCDVLVFHVAPQE
ncbi:hypothetical protein MVEN_01373000 [Mycena venus]|uniref:F-box domain-containing protein n=1 Tax=Mycena venus TaxID=2733690 RepID=A0A8H6XUS4_9AGAR|nr:hypothetical protein MVEN_01373000 [Mycena venus]